MVTITRWALRAEGENRGRFLFTFWKIGDGSYSHFNLGKENGDGAAEWSAPSSFLATNRMGAGIERRLEFF